MLTRHLPRYATLPAILGVTDHGVDTFGLSAPAFPHNDGGSGEGGATDEGGGDTAGSATGEGDVAKYKAIAKQLEKKLNATPKPEQVEEWKKAAAELQEIRDGQRTDSEKATARAEAAEKELAELKPKFERLEVAYAKGLPPNLAKRLTGSTREEMEADADELLAEFGDAIKSDREKADAEKKDKRTAARKGAAGDAGPRGTREDTKPSVSSGFARFEAKRAKKTPAVS